MADENEAEVDRHNQLIALMLISISGESKHKQKRQTDVSSNLTTIPPRSSWRLRPKQRFKTKLANGIFGRCMLDEELIFGHLKNILGAHLAQLREQAKSENNLGLKLLTMILSKYWEKTSQLYWSPGRSKKQIKYFF